MKASKKMKQILPEVHILGDLKDLQNLLTMLNKKKTIVIFYDGEQGAFYLEIEGKFELITQNDIGQLEKEYTLVTFSFFPSKKRVEPLMEAKPEVESAEMPLTGKPEKKEKKEKKKHKVKHEKKEKKDHKGKKEHKHKK
jgi:hypothetical protein